MDDTKPLMTIKVCVVELGLAFASSICLGIRVSIWLYNFVGVTELNEMSNRYTLADIQDMFLIV